MTYNIRLDLASDGENYWPNRSEFLVAQLKFYEPSVFGVQEALPHQVKYIDSQLPDYNFIGEGRDGKNIGEYSAIFYNKEKFSIIESGTFWLSNTPKKVSKGWDAALPRICTYALLNERITNTKLWVFNTHFGHIGEEARLNSVKLILQRIDELNSDNNPVIFMGDLNAEPNSKPILFLKTKMKDSKEISVGKPFGPMGTFNSFNHSLEANIRIDYIFLSNNTNIKVLKYGVLNNSKDLKFPSDHFPVLIKVGVAEK